MASEQTSSLLDQDTSLCLTTPFISAVTTNMMNTILTGSHNICQWAWRIPIECERKRILPFVHCANVQFKREPTVDDFSPQQRYRIHNKSASPLKLFFADEKRLEKISDLFENGLMLSIRAEPYSKDYKATHYSGSLDLDDYDEQGHAGIWRDILSNQCQCWSKSQEVMKLITETVDAGLLHVVDKEYSPLRAIAALFAQCGFDASRERIDQIAFRKNQISEFAESDVPLSEYIPRVLQLVQQISSLRGGPPPNEAALTVILKNFPEPYNHFRDRIKDALETLSRPLNDVNSVMRLIEETIDPEDFKASPSSTESSLGSEVPNHYAFAFLDPPRRDRAWQNRELKAKRDTLNAWEKREEKRKIEQAEYNKKRKADQMEDIPES